MKAQLNMQCQIFASVELFYSLFICMYKSITNIFIKAETAPVVFPYWKWSVQII